VERLPVLCRFCGVLFGMVLVQQFIATGEADEVARCASVEVGVESSTAWRGA